jgi:2-amino-4-hydroxy-6-hydroxymethyldihydropteridine diphosphokinase
MPVVYLGLGSNRGDRLANLRGAARRLHNAIVITQVSSVYETEPVGFAEQPWFLNAVLEGYTELSAEELLQCALATEKALGRARSFPNAPRTIDIDILLYGEMEIASPSLTVPHPRFTERGFTLCPLTEIAPLLEHPVTGDSMESILATAVGLEETRHFADQNWYAEAAPEMLF